MSEQAVEHLQEDPHLGPLVDEHGPLTLDPADNLFHRTITSIIRQQVSMDSAAAIRERLFNTFDVTPTTIANADPDALQAVGLSAAKSEYIQNVANAFNQHGYSHQYFEDMTDDDVMDELTQIRGVGPWTSRMVLMFGLGRPDVFPVEDLGIRKGMNTLFDNDPTRTEMRDLAATHWQPYRSYASLYIWRAYDD